MSSEKLHEIQKIIQEWDDKKGQDRCWFYPILFSAIAKVADVKLTNNFEDLPHRQFFKEGCLKYQLEIYGPPEPEKPNPDGNWEQFPSNEIIPVGDNIFIYKNQVWFKVGEQCFSINQPSSTEDHAYWVAKMLEKALKNYRDSYASTK